MKAAATILELCTKASEAYEDGRLSASGKIDAAIDLLTFGGRKAEDFEALRQQFECFLGELLAVGFDAIQTDYSMDKKRESFLRLIDGLNKRSGVHRREGILKIAQSSDASIRATPGKVRGRQDLNDAALRFLHAFEETSASRTMFLTSNNLLGLSPQGEQEGDEVWLLSGARVPFVLRPSANPGEYLLVGECYVQGGMHGALVTSGFAGEEQEITLV